MTVESSGGLILGIYDNSDHCEHFTCLDDLMAGVGEQDGAQALPLKLYIYGEPADQCDRHGIARQLACHCRW